VELEQTGRKNSVPEIDTSISVVIPTVGRPALLAETLASLARCRPQPAEILVVSQNASADAAVVAASGIPGARLVPSDGHGTGRAVNDGLKRASNQTVLIVHDDCVVREDWVAVAAREMSLTPEGIVSGRVLPPPGADPRAVPSTIELDRPRDYTGELHCGVLYPNNMACPRDSVLALGAFDEAILHAEDCDLCYRWLRAGRQLRHVPDLVVWHRDWRSPAQLRSLYVSYYHGSGMFYAKHLAAGDLHVLRFIYADCRGWLRSLAAAVLRATPGWADARRGVVPGLPRGLWAGWRRFRTG
jgi:GT2 family glycosyltransferase